MTSSNRNASGFRQLASPTGWYWLAGALVLGAPAVVSAQGAVADDRAALEALYDATDGVNWVSNDNWKTEEPLGEWHGVTTDSTGRVTCLELGDNEMSGTIPAELGNLTGRVRAARGTWRSCGLGEAGGPPAFFRRVAGRSGGRGRTGVAGGARCGVGR